MNTSAQGTHETLKITAQDFYGLHAPSECALRVYLRAKGERETEPGAFEQVLMRLGQRHEANHLATFPQVVDLRPLALDERVERTVSLLKAGCALLYQPVLKVQTDFDGVAYEAIGEPDFLIREGDGYVIRDVKMARRVDEKNHPEILLQLQFYGWLFEQIFGTRPVRLEALNGQGQIVNVVSDNQAVLAELRELVRLKRLAQEPYDPVGWSKCIGCGFHNRCWMEARKSGDVALVFGVDQNLASELHRQGTRTIKELVSRFDETTLAGFKRPWGKRMQKVGKSAGAILQAAQALLTNRETVLSRPAVPEHANYVMFDLEGIPPQFEKLGKIYLWGMQVFGRMPGEFMPAVAGFGEEGDREGWNQFLAKASTIFQQYGDIPFVHWSPYERTQIGEYVRRCGDLNGVAERVLRNLLDLLPIARESVVLPLFSYSLKEVERYVGFRRTQDEYGGLWSMAKYIEATETGDEESRNKLVAEILLYNKEDLAATWAVLEWLRSKATA
jgi:predicted RecB family nuclease